MLILLLRISTALAYSVGIIEQVVVEVRQVLRQRPRVAEHVLELIRNVGRVLLVVVYAQRPLYKRLFQLPEHHGPTAGNIFWRLFEAHFLAALWPAAHSAELFSSLRAQARIAARTASDGPLLVRYATAPAWRMAAARSASSNMDRPMIFTPGISA